jgi:hypothetical protein
MDRALDKINSPADGSPGELDLLAAAEVSTIVPASRDSGNSDKPADLLTENAISFSRAAGSNYDWDYRPPRATGRYEQYHRGRSRIISADRRHIWSR